MESAIPAKGQTVPLATVWMGVGCIGVGVDPPSEKRKLFSAIPNQRIKTLLTIFKMDSFVLTTCPTRIVIVFLVLRNALRMAS